MSANEVVFPFAFFPDIDGDPLEGGHIYVGVAGTDAKSNPVSVYWDQALTIPASQPLRTSGGLVVRAGTPSKFYVSGADGFSYSIRVENKNNSLVYSSLDAVKSVTVGSLTDYVFATVADMVIGNTIGSSNVSFKSGQSLRTLGFYSVNDGGAARYVVTADIANGYNLINLGGGLTATLQTTGMVGVRQIGAIADGSDQSPALQHAINMGLNVDFGNSGVFGVATSLTLAAGKHIIASGAVIKALSGIEASYAHKGIFEVTTVDDIILTGLSFEIVDTDLPASGALVPQVSAIKMSGGNRCELNNLKFKGGSNRFTADPSYKFIGIVDVRGCNDIDIKNCVIDGQYTIVNPGYATSTEALYIDNCNRVNVDGNRIKNAWSSGAVFTDVGNVSNVFTNNIVINTKGSNLNVGGQEILVDNNIFDGSTDQGGLSIGEGTTTETVGCVITNNIIKNNFRAGIATSEMVRDCVIMGNQIRNNNQEGLTTEVGAGVRAKGKFINISNNVISQAGAPAIASSSTSLVSPEADRIIISGNQISGVPISITAPNCSITNNTILGVTGGTAIVVGFRCAGATVTDNRSISCGRTVSYSPNTADPADYAGVMIHSNEGYNNTLLPDTSSTVQVTGVTGGRVKNKFSSSAASLVLDDVLHSTEITTSDTNFSTVPAVGGKSELLVNDAFGTTHRWDFSTGYVSGGVPNQHASLSVVQTGAELRGVPGVTKATLVMNSPDGQRWELAVSNAGALVITGPL